MKLLTGGDGVAREKLHLDQKASEDITSSCRADKLPPKEAAWISWRFGALWCQRPHSESSKKIRGPIWSI